MPLPRWLRLGRDLPLWLRPHHYSQSPTVFRLIVATVSGAALGFSFIGFYIAFYSWVSLALLMIVLFGARPRVAALCGFLHGAAFVFVTLPWTATVLRVHGGLSEVSSWAALALLAAAWGVLTGGFALAVSSVSRRSIASACLAAPFFCVTMEFIRTRLPEIGFPWNLLGYPASANLALLQITAWTGIYGLSFLVAGFNALLAWADAADALPGRKRVAIVGVVTAALMATAILGPRLVPQAHASHHARLIQPDFPEAAPSSSDWYADHKDDLDSLEQLTLSPGSQSPDLIVWPEVPTPFSYQDARFVSRAEALARKAGKPFLSGVIEWKPMLDSAGHATGNSLLPYNSAVLLDAQGKRIFSYDKVHLVPFGEFEPFPLLHRVVTSLSDQVGGFQAGKTYSVGKLPNGQRFAVFLCYEAIFPGEIRRFTAGGAELFINLSNDGWFGRSAAADQHLRMARVRSVENRRWMLRDTNNGFTVAVDPYGRITAAMPADVRGALDVPYDFRSDRTLYSRWGDWFAWLCVLVSIGFLLGPLWERRRGQ